MSIPRVLVCYVHRPMCVGLFFRSAFQQAGCRVISAGPLLDEVYGHRFPANDVLPPDILCDNQPIDAARIVPPGYVQADDLIVMIDQYDPFYLTGTPPGRFVHVAVENWNREQRARYEQRMTTAEFYMIAHSNEAPLPEGAEFLPFGADPFVHPFNAAQQRDIDVCQIGSPYEPRPAVWNGVRRLLDGAEPVSPHAYGQEMHWSPRTAFGRAPSYQQLAEVYNRSKFALSASNVDFVPMRFVEAACMGAVLISDVQPSIVATFGPPYPDNPAGLWLAHRGGIDGQLEAVERAVHLPEDVRIGIQANAFATAHAFHLYYHRAQRILDRVGLRGATRLVGDK